MEIKLPTYFLIVASSTELAPYRGEHFDNETQRKYLGEYCMTNDAISIIEKLQARIAELEGVVGELEWACNSCN